MKEYIIAQHGGTEFYVLRLIGEVYHVIGTAVNREYAQQIVDALNPVEEKRLGWSDLERVAAERGR